MENLKETVNADDMSLEGVETTRICCDHNGKVKSLTFKDKTGKILEMKVGAYADDMTIFTNRKQEKEDEEND